MKYQVNRCEKWVEGKYETKRVYVPGFYENKQVFVPGKYETVHDSITLTMTREEAADLRDVTGRAPAFGKNFGNYVALKDAVEAFDAKPATL